jgi:hypothetical protein
LSVHLSGNQAPSCELAAQVVLAEGGRRYRVRYLYRTRNIGPGTGLGWRVGSLTGAPPWYGRSKDLASEDWREEEFTFDLPAGQQAAKLVLVYQRAAGTTRIEGTLELRWVRLAADVGGAPGREP